MTHSTESASQRPVGAWHTLVLAQFAAFSIVGCYATWTQRYLYGDGSVFFLNLLKRHEVLDYFPARHFVHWVTQIPMIVLLRDFGCRDLRILGSVYGATLYLLPLSGLLLTGWAARGASARYLVYPLVGYSCVFLNMSGFIVTESYTAVALFWPMLYLILFSERLTLLRSAALISLAVVATRSYEIYLFLAWPLIFVSVRRGWKSIRERRYAELLTCCLATGLFLTAFCLTVGSMRDPNRPSNAEGFIEQAILHLHNPPVWFSLLVLAGVSWNPVFPMPRLIRVPLNFALAGCGLFVLILPWAGMAAPWFQCCSRVQSLYVPMALGLIVVLKTTISRLDLRPDSSQELELWRFAIAACCVATVYQLGSTALWNDYRVKLTSQLTQRRGLVSFEEATGDSFEQEAASRSVVGLYNRKLNQFNWNWTMSSLSVALSALNLGEVSTIIRVPARTEYQPFDPNDPGAIPDLTEFGIRNHFKKSKS